MDKIKKIGEFATFANDYHFVSFDLFDTLLRRQFGTVNRSRNFAKNLVHFEREFETTRKPGWLPNAEAAPKVFQSGLGNAKTTILPTGILLTGTQRNAIAFQSAKGCSVQNPFAPISRLVTGMLQRKAA